MFPVALNLEVAKLLLVGQGEAFAKREAQLREAGAKHLFVCHPGEGRDPRSDFDAWLGVDASLRWHDSVIIMVAGLPLEEAGIIARRAREAGKLVNVEDVNELCDFYFTSFVRRGDLLIAVSTGGASPTLAKRVRDKIAHLFDEPWAGYTASIREFREGLRAKGKNMKEVAAECERFLEEKGWFKP